MGIYVKRHHTLNTSPFIFIWADQLSRKREGRLLERDRERIVKFLANAWGFEDLTQELTRAWVFEALR